MAAATGTVTFSPSPPSFLTSHLRRGHHQPASASITTIAFFARRSNRSRGKAAPVAHPDPDDGFGALEAELWRLRRLAELRIHRLATEADAAYRDLRSAVREASGDRVVLTFRRSSLHFLAGALLSLLACAVAARVLLGMILRAWRRRGLWGTGEGGRAAVVRRRDRSLGGKEVVVALPSTSSPMAAAARTSRVVPEPAKEEVWRRYSQAKKLPDWWPPKVGATATVMETSPSPEMEKSARMANRLVRAMIDNRVLGKDYRYDDAIQLRRLCKTSRVKVRFDTENARDSFYRAAVNFVLDDCSRAAAKDIVAAKINGEDPRDFLAGLASNIGLDEFRAATLVRASIATRTRTCFLQCWALEIQGKRAEALDELVKICRIYEVFPPEDNSAEMEMVAAGLEKNLSVDERFHLLYLYRSVRTDGNLKTAAEALGLSLPDEMRIQQQKD